jgi:flagellar biosynthesis/type III secretory pathway M-ring protein FliF/YscJ
MSGTDTAILGIKLAFSLAAVILILVVVVRPVVRMLRTKPEFLDAFQQMNQMPIEEDEEFQIPVDGEKPDRMTMLDEARADPNKTAMMVSRWLKDKK